MIKIKKGEHEFIVSQKSYEDVFKKIGFTIIEGKEKAKVGVSQKAPTKLEKTKLEEKLIEEEIKENEKKENKDNKDFAKVDDLLGPIGNNIEEDFGFEKKSEKPKGK